MSIFSRDHVIRYTLALSLALFAGCGSGSSGKPASDAGSTVPCTSDDACSGVCREGRCVPDPCSNGKKGGTETDVDCGGTCAPCAEGKACLKGQDCQSGVCRGGTCRAPSCDDGVTNAKETGTDCGGPDCEGCALDEPCEGDGDCKKGNCRDGTCKRALCKNGETDADHGETDTDCGGPNCDPCSEGKACEAGGDCRSGVCVDGTCAGRSHCNDNLKTGDETAVDCGGADCKACEPGKSCEKNRDCTTKFCNDGTCKEPSCDDGVTNGEETDVDCGGPDCPRCPANKACKRNQDCQSGVCDEGTCRSVPKSCEDLARAGITKDGVQEIDPDGGGGEKPFKVYCNMSHGKGGWTRLNLRKKADEGKKGLPFGSQGTKWADGSKLNWGQGSGYFQRPGDHHCTVYAIGDASRDKYKGKTTLWDYYDAEGNPIPPEQIEALAKTVDKGTFYEGKFDIVDIDGPFPNGGDGDGGKNSFSIAIDKNANHRPTGNGPLVLWFSRSPDMDKGTTHAIGSDFDSREDRTYGVDWKVVHDGGLPRFMGVKVDNNENLFSTFKNGCDREAGSRIAFEHPYFYVR